MRAPVDPDVGSRLEAAQVEGRDVGHPIELGVAGEEDLEPAIEAEPVDPVGADPSADSVAGFQHGDPTAGLGQRPGCGQPGEPGADDHGVDRLLAAVAAHRTSVPAADATASHSAARSSSDVAIHGATTV